MFCCALLSVHSSFAIILMGKRELVALYGLSSWCLVIIVWLFLTLPWVFLQFVIVIFTDCIHFLHLRTLVESRGLLCDATCVLKAERYKYVIKRCKPGILYISLPSWLTLRTSDYYVIIEFRVDSTSSTTSFKKVQCHVDLI